MMDKVLQRRRGQPLTLAILALELARRLSIPLEGVGFLAISCCACRVPTTCSILRRPAPVP